MNRESLAAVVLKLAFLLRKTHNQQYIYHFRLEVKDTKVF